MTNGDRVDVIKNDKVFKQLKNTVKDKSDRERIIFITDKAIDQIGFLINKGKTAQEATNMIFSSKFINALFNSMYKD